jgi:nicotinamidase-related amidase
MRRLEKTEFSVLDHDPLRAVLADLDRPTIIVAGIEAHVCVLGTVDDLLRRGWRVVVAGDAVDSRLPEHREQALATLRQLGAVVVPVEAVLFRLLRGAAHPAFKEISRLVR